jgi:hypothetical protein
MLGIEPSVLEAYSTAAAVCVAICVFIGDRIVEHVRDKRVRIEELAREERTRKSERGRDDRLQIEATHRRAHHLRALSESSSKDLGVFVSLNPNTSPINPRDYLAWLIAISSSLSAYAEIFREIDVEGIRAQEIWRLLVRQRANFLAGVDLCALYRQEIEDALTKNVPMPSDVYGGVASHISSIQAIAAELNHFIEKHYSRT